MTKMLRSELTPWRREFLEVFNQLPENRQKDFLAYLRYLKMRQGWPQKEKKREFAKVVGVRLEGMRRALGYDHHAPFARHLGYTPRNYRAYELGQRTGNSAQTQLLFKVIPFNVSLDWLFMGEGPMFRRNGPSAPKLEGQVINGPWGKAS